MPENAPGTGPVSFSPSLVDNHGRRITYLRLAITDRCNLRCRYCMPEKGVPPLGHGEILSFEELCRLVSIFLSLGIRKVRITGGEPFARRGCMELLRDLAAMPGLDSLHVTTNGVALAPHCRELAQLGIRVNLSLDTLDRRRFWAISRRDAFDAAHQSLTSLLQSKIPLKINTVILNDTTDEELTRLARIAADHPVIVRFIERMPFSGQNWRDEPTASLRDRLHRLFPGLRAESTDGPATATLFSVPGFAGRIGIIEGYARRFCQTCNKVRITPAGTLKTCLYDNGALDLRAMLRNGAADHEIGRAIRTCINQRATNGFAAERLAAATVKPSMATIGG